MIEALITDLNMPAASGYELIDLVRRCGRHRKLPIIAMSGDDHHGVAEKARLSGANAFFPKPFSPADMRRTLRKLLDDDCA